MDAGAVLVLVMALDSAAHTDGNACDKTANNAFQVLQVLQCLLSRDEPKDIRTGTEQALLQLQAVPRLFKLLPVELDWTNNSSSKSATASRIVIKPLLVLCVARHTLLHRFLFCSLCCIFPSSVSCS